MSQPTFQPYAPIRIATQEIFNAAKKMIEDTVNGTLNVSAVAEFQTIFSQYAYKPVHQEGKPFIFAQKDITGEKFNFQADMWKTTYKSSKTKQNRIDRLLLINEVIGKAEALQPRLIVMDGQMGFPFQMTCCGGLSAAFNISGQVRVVESNKVRECMKDILGITSQNPAVQTGAEATKVLEHWEGHVAGKTTKCNGHVPLKIPGRRPVFA